MMAEYLCLDCGGMGEGPVFLETAKDMYQGESALAVKFAKKGEMTYAGCPDCGSPNVFFDSAPTKSVEPDEDLEDEDIDVEDEDNDVDEFDDEDEELLEPDPPPKKRKKKTKKKKRKKRKSGQQLELAPESKKTRSRSASMSDGDNVTRETYVAREVPVHAIEASDQPNEICKVSKEKVVRRRRYKRKCKDCRQRFETKHRDIHYCMDCLRGFGRGR